MRPLAFAITANACACGPITAIDFTGADPKVNAITTASQPPATSAMAPKMRRSGDSRRSMRWSVVIEVLNAHAFGLEVAVDVNKAGVLGLEAGPAEAGSRIKFQ